MNPRLLLLPILSLTLAGCHEHLVELNHVPVGLDTPVDPHHYGSGYPPPYQPDSGFYYGPNSRHQSMDPRGQRFYGTPRQGYDNGFQQGREDRDSRQSEDYRRHSNQFDAISEIDFARGYNDGYEKRVR